MKMEERWTSEIWKSEFRFSDFSVFSFEGGGPSLWHVGADGSAGLVVVLLFGLVPCLLTCLLVGWSVGWLARELACLLACLLALTCWS